MIFGIGTYIRRFYHNERGNVAMMFGLSMVALFGVSGLAIDFTRANLYQQKLKTATDSAALAAARVTYDPANLTNPDIAAIQLAAAQSAFNANFGSEAAAANVTMSLSINAGAIAVTAAGKAQNAFGGLFGSPFVDVSVKSESAMNLAADKMEIAFVLDNTGSMSSSNKMPLLKQAVHKFISKLKQGVKSGGDVKLALVPFDTKIKIDPAFASGQPWMRQTLVDVTGWSGCIMDRAQPYDTNATAADVLTPDTLFDAVDDNYNVFPQSSPTSCNLRAILPLTSSFSSYDAAVNTMSPNGQTNGTIGLVWGLQALTPGEPFNTASAFGGGYRKIIVFLTDGANTRNRWTTDAATIDARMLAACTAIKSKGVELYTIGLVSANMSVLTPCATKPGMAYQVTDPAQIPDLFDIISQKLVSVRLTK